MNIRSLGSSLYSLVIGSTYGTSTAPVREQEPDCKSIGADLNQDPPQETLLSQRNISDPRDIAMESDDGDLQFAAVLSGVHEKTINIYKQSSHQAFIEGFKKECRGADLNAVIELKIDHGRVDRFLKQFECDLVNASNQEAAEYVVSAVSQIVKYSCTGMSLNHADINPIFYKLVKNIIAISRLEDKQIEHDDSLEYQAVKAIATECGNCGEMSCVGAFLLDYCGFSGKVEVMTYKNHQFLRIGGRGEDAFIADPWAKKSYPVSMLENQLKYYKIIGKDKFERQIGKLCAYGVERRAGEVPKSTWCTT